MKPKKVHLIYHHKTNTTWANCPEWNERRQTEAIEYGYIELDIDNIFEMKQYMELDGYIHVKDDPYKMLHSPPNPNITQ